MVTGSESGLVDKQAPLVTAATMMFPDTRFNPLIVQLPLETGAVPITVRVGFVL